MRRELIWAGIIGITFGLVIAFGVWRINSSLKSKPAETTTTPPPVQNQEFKIALNKPENDDVVTEDSVTVSGITKSLAWMTISGEEGDYIIQSEQSGVFEQEVDLIPGVNQIKITAFDPDGNKSTEKVLVVFSSSFEEKSVPSPTPDGEATGESDIKQKVAQKVAEALNKPKAYIGVVTDISDSTIQIKTNKILPGQTGEIKQIATGSEEIAVVKTTQGANKAVKLTDIAIGDFIVAMGYINGNSVLVAQRILITDPVTEPKINAFMGKGADVIASKGTLVFLFEEGKVTKSKAANIEDENKVFYVTQEEDEKTSTRSIFVVQ